MKEDFRFLQTVLDRAVDNRMVFGTSFCVKYQGRLWCGSSGNLDVDQQYFIASTTKLFVTAIILQLKEEGRLSLDDRIGNHLDHSIVEGVNTFKGKEHSHEITIRNLLAHTSGIPDYFQQKDSAGKSFEKELKKGNDRYWTFEEALAYSKTLPPLFEPNARRRAHYSDTNFQLLGRIIENLTGLSLQQNYDERICKPLGLTKTYLYHDISDRKPMPLYYKSKVLNIPGAMASFGPDGGIVSTSPDMLTFIEAFFSGKIFTSTAIEELSVWNNIFYPMQSGIGIHRFKLPWIFNPTGAIPELIGHSGLSGALAYCNPKSDLYLAGTVNQVASPGLSFKTAIKLMQKILKS